MLYYTKYSEQKFYILNKHKVFITKEQVEDALKLSNKIEKKGDYYFAEKSGVRVVYKKENELNKVITFYPIK